MDVSRRHPANQRLCSAVESMSSTKQKAFNSYLLQLETAHYGSSVSDSVSIFRAELCTVLDTKVRAQSALINRYQRSGSCTLKARAKVKEHPNSWLQISVSFYTTLQQCRPCGVLHVQHQKDLKQIKTIFSFIKMHQITVRTRKWSLAVMKVSVSHETAAPPTSRRFRTRVGLLFFTAKFFYCHHLYGRIRSGFVGQVCVHIQGLWLQFSVMLS